MERTVYCVTPVVVQYSSEDAFDGAVEKLCRRGPNVVTCAGNFGPNNLPGHYHMKPQQSMVATRPTQQKIELPSPETIHRLLMARSKQIVSADT